MFYWLYCVFVLRLGLSYLKLKKSISQSFIHIATPPRVASFRLYALDTSYR